MYIKRISKVRVVNMRHTWVTALVLSVPDGSNVGPMNLAIHDDVIKWKHFPRDWPFMRGIHRSPMNSPHKGQCRGALMFSLICVWINGWVNNRKAGDLKRYLAHHDVSVMSVKRSRYASTGILGILYHSVCSYFWTKNDHVGQWHVMIAISANVVGAGLSHVSVYCMLTHRGRVTHICQ